MLGDHSWLCTQESVLVVLTRPYGMPGIEPWLALCKANALPVTLSPKYILLPKSQMLYNTDTKNNTIAKHKQYVLNNKYAFSFLTKNDDRPKLSKVFHIGIK